MECQQIPPPSSSPQVSPNPHQLASGHWNDSNGVLRADRKGRADSGAEDDTAQAVS